MTVTPWRQGAKETVQMKEAIDCARADCIHSYSWCLRRELRRRRRRWPGLLPARQVLPSGRRYRDICAGRRGNWRRRRLRRTRMTIATATMAMVATSMTIAVMTMITSAILRPDHRGCRRICGALISQTDFRFHRQSQVGENQRHRSSVRPGSSLIAALHPLPLSRDNSAALHRARAFAAAVGQRAGDNEVSIPCWRSSSCRCLYPV